MLDALTPKQRPSAAAPCGQEDRRIVAQRMLMRPRRGLNGLPHTVLCNATFEHGDRDLTRQQKVARRRNMSVRLVNGLRFHKVFNAKFLANTLGHKDATKLHRRVTERVLTEISSWEANAHKATLGELLMKRACALFIEAEASFSRSDARPKLEGGMYRQRLQGWDHPELLNVASHLTGLKIAGQEVYSVETIEEALRRISRVALHVKTLPPGLASLKLVAFRRLGCIRYWYRKTDILLDMFAGKFTVYCMVDNPTIGDLYVKPSELKQLACARNPLMVEQSQGYAKASLLAQIAGHRFGDEVVVDAHFCRRVVRSGAVRTRTYKSKVRNRDRPRITRTYNIKDTLDLLERHLNGSLTETEAPIFFNEIDVTEFAAKLFAEGRKSYAISTRLSARGIVTLCGAPWRQAGLSTALKNMANGARIVGLWSGPSSF